MGEFDTNDPRDHALWELLGKARRVEASPYFHRKVMRALEEASAETRSIGWHWLLRYLLPSGACAALALITLGGVMQPAHTQSSVAVGEFETIANLDLLLADYESSIWLDGSLSSVSY